MNEKDILKCLGLEFKENISSADSFFYSLIFNIIGEKIDILNIIELLSDEEVKKRVSGKVC